MSYGADGRVDHRAERTSKCVSQMMVDEGASRLVCGALSDLQESIHVLIGKDRRLV